MLAAVFTLTLPDQILTVACSLKHNYKSHNNDKRSIDDWYEATFRNIHIKCASECGKRPS
jgi:hypothetical protein